MPGEDVDRTAVAEDVERNLDPALPTDAREKADARGDDRRMELVEQSIGFGPTKGRADDESTAEHGK